MQPPATTTIPADQKRNVEAAGTAPRDAKTDKYKNVSTAPGKMKKPAQPVHATAVKQTAEPASATMARQNAKAAKSSPAKMAIGTAAKPVRAALPATTPKPTAEPAQMTSTTNATNTSALQPSKPAKAQR